MHGVTDNLTFDQSEGNMDTSMTKQTDAQQGTNPIPAMDAKQRLNLIPLWATIVSYIVGFLWTTCMVAKYDWMPDHGMITLFTVIFFFWAEMAMKSIPRPGKENWFWMACAIAIAIGMDIPHGTYVDTYGDVWPVSPMMFGWNYLVLHGIAIYWILCRSGRLIDNKTGSMFILDIITGVLIAPLRGIPNRIRRIVYGFKDPQASSLNLRNVTITLFSILFALPVLAYVIHLLGRADNTFGNLINDILSGFELDTETLIRFVHGVFVSGVVFSLMSSCVIWEKPVFSGEKIRNTLESFRILPIASGVIIYGIFISVYLLFFGVQGSHLIGAFHAEIPGELTAAEYARSGFFELCIVSAINFGLIAANSVLSKVQMHKSGVLRTMTMILLIENILLAITAASKLILYIERFGFTTNRLLSFWAVLVLTCGCILSIIAIYDNKSHFSKWIWFSVATFVPLCYF